MSEPRRIAIFLPNWVGDVVMATPAIRALRSRFARAEMVAVGKAVALDTLAGLGWFDETIEDVSRRRPRVVNWVRMRRRLRRRRADLAVLLPNSFRAALLARMAGARRIAGYDRDGRGRLLTDRLEPPTDAEGRFTPVPMIEYYNALAASLGATDLTRRMELAVEPRFADEADALLAGAGVNDSAPLVMLNAGASFGPSKLWAPGRYAALADRLIERRGARIIINAAPSERDIAADVENAMTRPAALSFARRDNTLGLLKALLRRCDLLVTNDTGARHFAAALGIGLVTLFGSTDPVWARIDCGRERIVRVDVPCGPCQRKVCPLDGADEHRCMKAITVERVLDAAETVLDEAARARQGAAP